MGLQDRDYYWEDRKRRENKFSKQGTYYRPKEFRRSGGGKPPDDWQTSPRINKQQWKLLLAFFSGGFFAFWAVMIVLNTNADILFWAFEVARKALVFIGLL